MEVAEDAARTLWCPFARALNWQDEASGAVNRVHTPPDEQREGGPDPDCMCLGRRCMAWVPTGFGVGSCGLVRRRERIGIAPQTPAARYAEKAEADLKYVNEARTLDLADHQTKIKEMAERIRKAEAERDALAGRRPEVLLHWDSDGDFSWGATDGVDVVCVDERCPNDRVYETTGALSVEVIQRVADGRAQHPIDALDQIAREATTPEDPVHD